MAKMTKEKLKAIGIFNPHNFCTIGGGRIFVGYSPQVTGRAYRTAKWQVCGVREKTDPKAFWMDNGQKAFDVNGVAANSSGTHAEIKEIQRLAAIAWATEKYGIDDWVKDPFGDYQERRVWERVAALLDGVEQKAYQVV